jgi:hypothetical protein
MSLMSDPTTTRNLFRADLDFHDKLDHIVAGPRLYRDDLVDITGAQGTLHGRGELKRFIEEVGLDSIVLTDQLRDLPSPQFRQTFAVHSSEAIVGMIERRFAAYYEAFSRVLEGTPIKEIDPTAFYRFERLTLGATKIETHEGVARLRKWFSDAHSSAREP